MKQLRHQHIFLILSFICMAVAGAYATNAPAEISETLHTQLARTKNPADSILILENLYDLALQFRPAKADSIAEVTYQTARRASNYPAALDMLRQRTNLNARNDSVIQLMRSRALSIPHSADRDRTVAFIGIMHNSYNARNLDEDKRRERFGEEIKRYIMNPPESVYDNIVLLHGVCVNLARETRGELLVKYMDKLGKLIDSVPDPEYVLHNVFNVQGAMDYSLSGNSAKALEADRNLLKAIDSLEVIYTKAGRPYRYYDSNRYIIYTRMLGNWTQLTPAEIEEYYSKAIYIRDKDIRACNSYASSPRPDIYYAMSNKDYETALRLISECIDKPVNKSYRRNFLKYLFESAVAMGDKDTAIKASGEYIGMLEDELSQRVQERYKELQIIYDVNEMKTQYNTLSSEKRMSEYESQRILMIISLVFVAVLLILAVVLVFQYRRARRLAVTLSRANDALRLESDNLRESQAELTKARDVAEKASNFKSDFIKNLSREVAIPLKAISEYSHLIVDCTESTSKPYLERYADLIEQNCALVNSIAADVLHLAEIDSATLTLNRENVDLYKVVSAAVDTVAPRMPESVTLALDEDSPHVDVSTDPRRLQQILISLIANGAKFTPAGSVVVSYRLDSDSRGVEISVTDTGIGVPPDKAEYIFERFAKLDKDTQGIGLGLTISRLLARLLGGDLNLDTSYKGGARFVVNLPLTAKS